MGITWSNIRLAALAASVSFGSVVAGPVPVDAGTIADEARAEVTVVPLDKPFDLALGETVMIDGGPSVMFASVVADERCPLGVRCAWEGNAELVLEVAQPGADPVSLRLNTHGRYSTTAPYSRYDVELVGLAPHPWAGWNADQPYVATLLASHRDWFRILQAVVGDAPVDGACVSSGTLDLAWPDPEALAMLVKKDRRGKPTPGSWVASGADELAERVEGELIAEIRDVAHILIVDDEGRRVNEYSRYETRGGDLVWFLTGAQSPCRRAPDSER